MFTLQISYPVRDYEAFKKVFDTDPAGRAARRREREPVDVVHHFDKTIGHARHLDCCRTE